MIAESEHQYKRNLMAGFATGGGMRAVSQDEYRPSSTECLKKCDDGREQRLPTLVSQHRPIAFRLATGKVDGVC